MKFPAHASSFGFAATGTLLAVFAFGCGASKAEHRASPGVEATTNAEVLEIREIACGGVPE